MSIGFELFIYGFKIYFYIILKIFKITIDIYIILFSSANKTGLDFPLIVSDKSFAYRGKGKGHKIDPCGTQCFITPQSEDVL